MCVGQPILGYQSLKDVATIHKTNTVVANARGDVLTSRRKNMNCRGGSRTNFQIEPNTKNQFVTHTHTHVANQLCVRVPLIKPLFALRTHTIKVACMNEWMNSHAWYMMVYIDTTCMCCALSKVDIAKARKKAPEATLISAFMDKHMIKTWRTDECYRFSNYCVWIVSLVRKSFLNSVKKSHRTR